MVQAEVVSDLLPPLQSLDGHLYQTIFRLTFWEGFNSRNRSIDIFFRQSTGLL